MVGRKLEVVEMAAVDTHRLRQTVLRTGTRSTAVVFDGDDDAGTFHLGVRSPAPGGELVGVSTWLRRVCPHAPDRPAVQLRGMATDLGHRGVGVATALLDTGRARCEADGIDVVWARARRTAADFYFERGFVPVGDEYTDETTGLAHVDVMLGAHGVSSAWRFETERLRAAPWHEAAGAAGLDLAGAVATILSERTTVALPPAWQGDLTPERARAWIAERDAESPTLLVCDRSSGRVVGLVILAAVTDDHPWLDLRVGYVIDEALWGRGLASELLTGLVAWAQAQPLIRTVTGGVDVANAASIRVLEKAGFNQVERSGDTAQYRLRLVRGVDAAAEAQSSTEVER